MRRVLILLFALGVSAATGLSADKDKPVESEKDPDYRVQGEYKGKVADKDDLGAQVVALGKGKFDVYFLTGGLPGAGRDGKGRVKAAAITADGKTTLTSKEWSGTISDGTLSGKTKEGDSFKLTRVERKSPTMGAKPPEGAVVLFDGSNADAWSGGKLVEDKLLYRGTSTKKPFAAGRYHVEFRTPFQPTARGQGRGNSGVFVQGVEVQVLDSFGLEGKKDECGAFYGRAHPTVNMCLPPLAWQTYDIEVKADDKGNTVATVLHNGVKVHENFVLHKGAPRSTPIHLQDHGNPVVYRNIWVLPSK